MSKGITDLIIRIKNSYMSRKEVAIVTYSKINLSILEILKKTNFIKDFLLLEEGHKKTVKVELLYHGLKPAISGVQLVTKPGRRSYSKAKDLKPVMSGFGTAILTTPSGVITDKEAHKLNIGGEVLFKVW
jgi:small subunit ribosomal protein S8